MRMQINARIVRGLSEKGVSLIEMVVFIVVVSIGLLALTGVYRQATLSNVDPLIRLQATEAAQSLLDEILALKYDENTPTGGIPACGTGAVACTNTKEGNMNDVDDYHLFSDVPRTGFNRSVTVVANNNIKLITVTVTSPAGETVRLAVERANF